LLHRRQLPEPLHIPSFWQVVGGSAAHSLSGSVPLATARHRPFACPVLPDEQALQRPEQPLSQQTPSTHALDVHCPLTLHGAPLAWVATHRPPAQ
jgi:hypothetical protein